MYFTKEEVKEIRERFKESFDCNGFNALVTPEQCALRQAHFNCKKNGCGLNKTKKLSLKDILKVNRRKK